jgi:flavorubredoxin
VKIFNLAVSDIGAIAMAMVDAATLVIGTPTMLFGPHPLAVNAAYFINLLRPKVKYAAVIGSYGWGGNTVETLKGMLNRLSVEMFDPVYVKGVPDSQSLRDLETLADRIMASHSKIINSASPKT